MKNIILDQSINNTLGWFWVLLESHSVTAPAIIMVHNRVGRKNSAAVVTTVNGSRCVDNVRGGKGGARQPTWW